MDKKNKEKKEDLEKKVLEFEDQLKRAVADYRNLEKRFQEEKKEVAKYANKELLEKLIPAFDTLFIAEKFVNDEGLKLTIKKVKEVLKETGVEMVETENKDFDPNTMECVDTIKGEENKVIEEVKPGFMLYNKLLCPAQVKVGMKKADETTETLKEDLQNVDQM